LTKNASDYTGFCCVIHLSGSSSHYCSSASWLPGWIWCCSQTHKSCWQRFLGCVQEASSYAWL